LDTAGILEAPDRPADVRPRGMKDNVDSVAAATGIRQGHRLAAGHSHENGSLDLHDDLGMPGPDMWKEREGLGNNFEVGVDTDLNTD